MTGEGELGLMPVVVTLRAIVGEFENVITAKSWANSQRPRIAVSYDYASDPFVRLMRLLTREQVAGGGTGAIFFVPVTPPDQF